MNYEKRILITGASRGIGKAIALHMAKQGFVTTVHYHSREDLAREVVEQIQRAGGQADTLQFDVSDRISTQAALEHYIEEQGAFYGVVCNAGIARDAAFPAMTDEQWDGVIHTNLDAFYNVLKPLIMPMIRLRNGGRIVTLSSVSGLVGNRGQVNYSAAKAGIIGATKALSVELAKRKITVNCVAPGVIETDMIDETYKDEMIKAIPMRQFGKPDDIAATVSFLFSEGAGYITRQVISVNGGMC
ncbi:MAG: 3-oxoacyl-[acyl-carrier protein] reductase [Kiritimatiellia bacterium]